MAYSLEYKNLYKIKHTGNEFSLKDSFNKLKLGEFAPIPCSGFGNHLITKTVIGHNLLIFFVWPNTSENYSWFMYAMNMDNLNIVDNQKCLLDYAIPLVFPPH